MPGGSRKRTEVRVHARLSGEVSHFLRNPDPAFLLLVTNNGSVVLNENPPGLLSSKVSAHIAAWKMKHITSDVCRKFALSP